MLNKKYKIKQKIWLYNTAKAAWHFVSIPKDISEEIRFFNEDKKTPLGSIKVTITIAKLSWETSIFPDKKSGCYLLPIKAEIRKKQNISIGDEVDIILS